MTKQYIIDEIKRTAAKNGGTALGRERFFTETGIKDSAWYGKYWVRWSDAIREAGLVPNRMNEAYATEFLIEKLIALCRELGRFPVAGDLRMKARTDCEFPSHTVFGRLGSKRQLIARVWYPRTRLRSYVQQIPTPLRWSATAFFINSLCVLLRCLRFLM